MKENELIGSHAAKIDASHGAAELVLSGWTEEMWRCGGAFYVGSSCSWLRGVDDASKGGGQLQAR